jgi:hypothetical protein
MLDLCRSYVGVQQLLCRSYVGVQQLLCRFDVGTMSVSSSCSATRFLWLSRLVEFFGKRQRRVLKIFPST